METNYTTSPSTEQQQRDNFTQHGVAAYKLTTNNRAYAADQFAQSALGAVAKAWHEINIEGKGRTSFTRERIAHEVFEPLTKLVPEIVQERPGVEAELPKPWTDQITGKVADNPFAHPVDLTSQAILERRAPLLARHLQATAKGVTYSYLAKLKDEAEARERMRRLRYSEVEHESNPYRGTNITTSPNTSPGATP